MRRTLTICRTGLAGAAAVALLAACGGNDSTNASSSSSSTSSSSSAAATTTGSSSASAGGPAADTEFCKQAATVDDDLAGLDTSDPTQVASVFQQLADKLHTLKPPAVIQSDWNTFVGAIDTVAQAAKGTDFNNQEQATAFLQDLSQLEAQLGTSSTNVENYLSTQCGIDTSDDSSDSSAPTS
jgi:hypothetical protein